MESYRTLVAWQLAHQLVLMILRSLNVPYRGQLHPLFDQLRRAVISIEANIVEGYALNTPAYKAKHLRIALGSAAECECLLRTGHELDWLPAGLYDAAQPILDRCIGALIGLVKKAMTEMQPSSPLTAHRSPRTSAR